MSRLVIRQDTQEYQMIFAFSTRVADKSEIALIFHNRHLLIST